MRGNFWAVGHWRVQSSPHSNGRTTRLVAREHKRFSQASIHFPYSVSTSSKLALTVLSARFKVPPTDSLSLRSRGDPVAPHRAAMRQHAGYAIRRRTRMLTHGGSETGTNRSMTVAHQPWMILSETTRIPQSRYLRSRHLGLNDARQQVGDDPFGSSSTDDSRIGRRA